MPRKKGKTLLSTLETLKVEFDKPMLRFTRKVKTNYTTHRNFKRLHRSNLTNHERVVKGRANAQGLTIQQYQEKWGSNVQK